MALTDAGSPTGSHDYRITGTGTWDDLVTLIGDTAVIDNDQSYYSIQGKLELECTLDPLYDATIHCFNGGGFSVANGGDLTFGASISYNGSTFYWHGCTIIEDEDSWARGSDNYGGNDARMKGSSSSITLYDSHWRFLNTSRSDPDFADGTLVIRQSQFYTAIANWMHMFCTVDWDDFENWLNSSSGSTTEFSADTVITQLDNYTPYKSGSGRQLVFYNGVPAQPIKNYGGLNFARWQGSSASIIYFDDPISTSLASVESTTGQFVAQERRSLAVAVQAAGTGVQARIMAEDVDGEPEINSLTDSGGILSTYLIRQRWPLSTHTPVDHTPHVLRIHKYGYRSQEIPMDVTPTSSGQGGFQLPIALTADSTIVQSKGTASAHTGITITYESSPVTWNGKDFSITVEGDLSTNPSLTIEDIRHYINAENEDGTEIGDRQPHELILPTLTTQIGAYYDGDKGVRVVDENGDPFPGTVSMQADDGTFFTPASTVTVSAEIKSTSGTPLENVRVYVEAASGGALPYQDSVSLTRSGSTATVTHTAHGLETGDEVKIRGCDQDEYNVAATITVTDANTYTYTVSGTPTTPATGTPTATAVLLNGLTNSSGIVQDAAFDYVGSQPVSGTARKASGSPYYKAGILGGTIGPAGLALQSFLSLDE